MLRRCCTLILAVLLAVSPAFAITGLDWRGESGTTRFQFLAPEMNGLPQYGPSGVGVTYIFRLYPVEKDGYYTTFFWGPSGEFTGAAYYGAHPYPNPPTTGTPTWEISIQGTDTLGDAVIFDQWYSQAFRAKGGTGVAKTNEFYWDLSDTNKMIEFTANTNYGDTPPPSPALTFGDAPWSAGNELCECILRGIQIYADYLSLADIASELASPLSTAAGAASIWYLNLNPTPDDISDKSGQGNDPAWVGAGRPLLWEEADPPPPPGISRFRLRLGLLVPVVVWGLRKRSRPHEADLPI